ncbi:MAG TPA: oligogalacturonate lyase family protein [Abditibacteriaceae bacterium]|nr:oligogalacturonate lyase family protein [Abditibacteriaceae bacterium]
MPKGSVFSCESRTVEDAHTDAAVRQVTDHASIHHHPFFFIPAYDNAMQYLIFVSHRSGAPQIFAEERATGQLIQLTDRDDLTEWSVYPSRDGRFVFFTAGAGAWRLDLSTLGEEELVNFAAVASDMRESGMVGAAMGTTALSWDDRWWLVSYKVGAESELVVIDTETGDSEVTLRRDSIAHMQFCPDDSNLIFYAGPVTDRVWLINRDGSNNRRLYERNVEKNEWITHETWIPGTRELAFVDWPHGVRCIHVDSGRERRICTLNAWHAVCDRTGTRMVADTNFPDIGLQLFDPREAGSTPRTLCYPQSSSVGEHWNGPFPYAHGPINVYAPQHTHPHPSFAPDGSRVVFTSDRTGHAQVYEVML